MVKPIECLTSLHTSRISNCFIFQILIGDQSGILQCFNMKKREPVVAINPDLFFKLLKNLSIFLSNQFYCAISLIFFTLAHIQDTTWIQDKSCVSGWPHWRCKGKNLCGIRAWSERLHKKRKAILDFCNQSFWECAEHVSTQLVKNTNIYCCSITRIVTSMV